MRQESRPGRDCKCFWLIAGYRVLLMTSCAAAAYGQCSGPIVADLVLQVKAGNKNVGKPIRLPLCTQHAIQGGIASWAAHIGERAAWTVIKSVDLRVRKGLRVSHRVQVKQPYRSALRKLGFKI